MAYVPKVIDPHLLPYLYFPTLQSNRIPKDLVKNDRISVKESAAKFH